MKHEAWGRWAEDLGVEIDPTQAANLEAYERLLIDRALPLGMIAPGDRSHLRERHLVDSVRAARALGAEPKTVADLGSGAGLPGVPLAIVRPDLRFVLAEVRRGRVAFLELVVDSLGLGNVQVALGAIEKLAPPLDVCLARALADPAGAWRLAEPLLAPDGVLLYWAGQGFEVTSGTPEGAHISVSLTSALADAGPVVIMTRK